MRNDDEYLFLRIEELSIEEYKEIIEAIKEIVLRDGEIRYIEELHFSEWDSINQGVDGAE